MYFFQNRCESASKSNDDMFVELSFEEETPIDQAYTPEVVNDDVDVNVNVNKKRKRPRNKFNWVKHSEWEDFDEVLDFLENEGFVCYDDKDLQMGQKFYFRCRRTPKSLKPYCDSRYVLFLPSNSNKIILLHSGNTHNHNDLMKDKNQMLSDEMIEFVNELFEKEVFSYSQVIKFIEEAREKYQLFIDEPNPRERQIEYRLKLYRNREIKPIISLGDLITWCENNTSYPANDDDAFVLAHESSPVGEALHFRFCLSTPRLLEKFIGLKTICIDATYKLNWNGFPLVVLGTVDREKKFHPLVYACMSHETTEDYTFVFETMKNVIENLFEESFEPEKLIADGAMPIRNAFFNVYESAKMDVMCFAHVIRNIRKRPFTMQNNKALVLDDIRKIQSAPNRGTFEKMSKLFCEKWEKIEPMFVEYFRNTWLGALANWYEGAALYTPSTNNAVESHNATIKRKVTLRRRLPFNQFLVAMKELTQHISSQFASGKRVIATKPAIKRCIMTAAAAIYQNHFNYFKVKNSEENISMFLVASKRCDAANANRNYYQDLVKRQWTSFDEFILYGFQMFYIIKLSKTSWNTESTCTCVCFFKENICKHVIALAMREKILACSDLVNPTSLSQYKRGAGSVNKAKKALVVQ